MSDSGLRAPLRSRGFGRRSQERSPDERLQTARDDLRSRLHRVPRAAGDRIGYQPREAPFPAARRTDSHRDGATAGDACRDVRLGARALSRFRGSRPRLPVVGAGARRASCGGRGARVESSERDFDDVQAPVPAPTSSSGTWKRASPPERPRGRSWPWCRRRSLRALATWRRMLVRNFFAPDADVLLDESFATSHCFRLAADDTSHRGQIGLAFTPAPGRGRDTLVDVAGVIWIDRATPALRSLEFLYTGLGHPRRLRAAGTSSFSRCRTEFPSSNGGRCASSSWGRSRPP